MRSLRVAALLVLGLLISGAAGPASSPSSAAISEETLRARRVGSHVLSFWWLPVEYWVAAARELKWSPDNLVRARNLLGDYLILGMVDASVAADGTLAFASLEDGGDRLALLLNGRETGPARRLDPEVKRLMPELTYFMRASLGPMAAGLRLVLFPNIDEKGGPTLSGSQPGEFQVRYRPTGEPPTSFLWRAPLTAVVGPQRCPKEGEELEASWLYCPWHGVRLDANHPDPVRDPD